MSPVFTNNAVCARLKLKTDWTPHEKGHVSFSESGFTVNSCTLFYYDSCNGSQQEAWTTLKMKNDTVMGLLYFNRWTSGGIIISACIQQPVFHWNVRSTVDWWHDHPFRFKIFQSLSSLSVLTDVSWCMNPDFLNSVWSSVVCGQGGVGPYKCVLSSSLCR